MKNVIKIAGIISLMLVIGFAFFSCDTGGGDDKPTPTGDDKPTPTTDPTKLRVSNETVTIPAGAPTSDDFSYVISNQYPLSNFITGTPKVQIAGGKLTLELDAPKDNAFQSFPLSYFEKITVTPTDAKLFWLDMAFTNATKNYILSMIAGNDKDYYTFFVYADKDVTLNGTYSEFRYNTALKKGWNYVSYGSSESRQIYTVTASQTKPSGATWTVRADD